MLAQAGRGPRLHGLARSLAHLKVLSTSSGSSPTVAVAWSMVVTLHLRHASMQAQL